MKMQNYNLFSVLQFEGWYKEKGRLTKSLYWLAKYIDLLKYTVKLTELIMDIEENL